MPSFRGQGDKRDLKSGIFEGNTFNDLKVDLHKLGDFVLKHYSKESGVTNRSVVFGTYEIERKLEI